MSSNLNSIYKPYTYLIGWSIHNKYYYGVRYAKDCHPDDLWVSYFTSSKHVKRFVAKHGDPDIIQIRKIFIDNKSAQNWEDKVLKRMNLREHKSFLNATNNKAFEISNPNPAKNIEEYNEWCKGKTWEELYGKEKAAEMRIKAKNRIPANKGKTWKIEDTSNYKIAANKRWSRPGFKDNFRKIISNSWSEERKRAQGERNKRRVSCIKCQKEMTQGGLSSHYRHNH